MEGRKQGAQREQEGEGDDVGQGPDEDEDPGPEAADEGDLPGHHADDADEHDLADAVHVARRVRPVRDDAQERHKEYDLHQELLKGQATQDQRACK